MPELAAQITAPESVSQASPSCDHCGAPIALAPIERDCCHRLTADIHALQLDSARQAGRHVIWLTKRVAMLEAKIETIAKTGPFIGGSIKIVEQGELTGNHSRKAKG